VKNARTHFSIWLRSFPSARYLDLWPRKVRCRGRRGRWIRPEQNKRSMNIIYITVTCTARALAWNLTINCL